MLDESCDLAHVWDRRSGFGEIRQTDSPVGGIRVDQHSLDLECVATVSWPRLRADVCGGLEPSAAIANVGGWILREPAAAAGIDRIDEKNDLETGGNPATVSPLT